MDLSKISTADLQALQAGDLSKVSTEGLQELQRQSAPKTSGEAPGQAQGFLDRALGVLQGAGEAVGSVASGAYAKPLGDVAGLLAIPAHAAGLTTMDPADVQNNVQRALQVQPQTAQGKQYIGAIGKAGDSTLGGFARTTGDVYAKGAGALGASQDVQDAIRNGTTEAVNQAPALLGTKLPAVGKARVAQAAEDAAAAAPKADAINAAHAAGYPILPSEANSGSVVRSIAGVGGKNDLNSLATLASQKVTQKIAAQDLGVPSTALKPSVLDALEDAAGQKYEAIRTADQNVGLVKTGTNPAGKPVYRPQVAGPVQLGKDADFVQAIKDVNPKSQSVLSSPADDLIEQLRQDMLKTPVQSPGQVLDTLKDLRAKMRSNLSATDKPDQLALGQAQQQAAEALEGAMSRYLQNTGQPKLYSAFEAARTQIAKIKEYRDAMNPATGDIDATALSNSPNRKAFTGGLKTIADAADALPNYVKNSEKAQVPAPVSALGYSLVAPTVAAGAAGYGAAGAHGLSAAVLPTAALAARAGARNMIMSPTMQRLLSAKVPQAGALSQLAASPISPAAALPLNALAQQPQ